MLSHNEKKGKSNYHVFFVPIAIGSYHTLLGIVLSTSAVGKAGTESEWSLTKAECSL